MNETFVKARSIFDQMMEESLARHSQGNSSPFRRRLTKRSRADARPQHTIGLSTDTSDQVPPSMPRLVGINLATSSLGTALIPSNLHICLHNLDSRLNCTTDNRLTSTLSRNPLAHTHSNPHNKLPRHNQYLTDPNLRLGLMRTAHSTRNLSSIQVMEVHKRVTLHYRRSSRCRLARVDLPPLNPVSIPSHRHNHNPRFNRSLNHRFSLNLWYRPNLRSRLNPNLRPTSHNYNADLHY